MVNKNENIAHHPNAAKKNVPDDVYCAHSEKLFIVFINVRKPRILHSHFKWPTDVCFVIWECP